MERMIRELAFHRCNSFLRSEEQVAMLTRISKYAEIVVEEGGEMSD